MACGLAVIANAAGALPEVVGTSGEAGLLVPQRNAVAMAQAMKDILSDPEKTERMGRAARRRVERIFQWSEAASRLALVFEETIRASDRRPRST